MKSPLLNHSKVHSNPVHFRLETLLTLNSDEVHQLARVAAGTLTSYRLVLGRCLLAIQQSGAFKKHGCSSAIHYATAVLGLHPREAQACRRVAQRLTSLPLLTVASERGSIPWSKLREIVRKASVQTESVWIELAKDHSYQEIELLVRRTPKGGLPGDVDSSASCTSELRCSLSDKVFAMLNQARRAYSLEKGEAVTTAELLEWALVSYLASHPSESEALEKVREEADKDLQAEKARELPIVEKAREIAMAMLDESKALGEEPDSMVAALGAAPILDLDEPGDDDREKPARVNLTDSPAQQSWENSRLRFNPDSRHTTSAQKTEILRRDGWCCQTPGCPNTVWLHLHHLKAYSEGGKTEARNLLCLCAGCHRNHHRGLLQVSADDQGVLNFSDSKGRDLRKQTDLQLASWLDSWLGWTGRETDSYTWRAHSERWSARAG